jgi:hypothetical protein
MYTNGRTPAKFTALNSFFLLTGVLGFIYFVFAAWFMRQFAPAATGMGAELAAYRHIALLFIALLELVLGFFIRQSGRQLFLFLQCLSAMFFLCAHGLLIFIFHSGFSPTATQSLVIGPVWPAFLLTVAVLLHVPLLFENKQAHQKKAPRRDLL